MMLETTTEMFQLAERGNFAIPATNFFDLDSGRVFVETAETLHKPLILAFAQAHMKMLPLEEAALIGSYLAKKSTCPVALHFDHGQDEAIIKEAIDLGFTSVIIDASEDSFERNVARSQEIVAYAHKRGVVVEAEIGHVGSGGSLEVAGVTDSIYTEVDEALRFAELTKVDSLAVSIGTAHGQYQGVPKINFTVLEELHQTLAIPLVLHGGSSSGDENLQTCANGGIRKINLFTDFITAAMAAIQEVEPTDYFQLKAVANQGMVKTLAHYYQVFETASYQERSV